ncbi:PTS transporter subunit IIC [Enterococcus durans]|uniref:PTS transporter subunit IIC n=1 Tax=Enterococcus durans TaxID=53345 RepID=UPI0035DDCAA2
MKNKPAKIITGTIISFVGFSMIKLGSSILAETLTAFSKLFNSAFHLTGVVPSNEAMMAMTLDTLGTNAAIILILGLVINILSDVLGSVVLSLVESDVLDSDVLSLVESDVLGSVVLSLVESDVLGSVVLDSDVLGSVVLSLVESDVLGSVVLDESEWSGISTGKISFGSQRFVDAFKTTLLPMIVPSIF